MADIKLNPSRMKGAEYERTVYVATVEFGTTKDDMKDPAFWSHVSNKLKPWDRIEVRSDDGTFFAEYLVLASERTWAKVHMLSYTSLTSAEVSQTQAAIENDEFEVRWRGPHLKFSVIRKADDAVLKDGMSKDEAFLWRKEYVKTVA